MRVPIETYLASAVAGCNVNSRRIFSGNHSDHFMITPQELVELDQYVRRNLPNQKAIAEMHRNEEGGFIQFVWHAQHFAVRPPLEVFQLKGANMFITGASMLMQAALRTRDKNSRVVEAVVENLLTAEQTMGSNQKEGLTLLSGIKKTLARLAGKAVK
jgi:hypothetical protein